MLSLLDRHRGGELLLTVCDCSFCRAISNTSLKRATCKHSCAFYTVCRKEDHNNSKNCPRVCIAGAHGEGFDTVHVLSRF